MINMCEASASIKSEEEVKELLADICTPSEGTALTGRRQKSAVAVEYFAEHREAPIEQPLTKIK